MIEQDLSPISQESDFLGELNAKLRDLEGFDTLANELLQNADDAKATQVIFDICDDALIVENNAVFRECDDVRKEECPWLLDQTIGHKCDFHRFRKIAGADKRNEEGMTGAFGFGFVSVYQITNNPEVISAAHHWRLHPDASPSHRIRPQKVNEPLDGTHFIFPWATDPEATLRIRLGRPAINPENIEEFTAKVAASAPQAILFLRYVTHIEIRRNGTLIKIVERAGQGNTTTIFDEGKATQWYIFKGNFDTKAAFLRNYYNGFIERKHSQILIAICHDTINAQGFYYATLPTQQQTNLPIHVNADFYPQSSRKSLAMGTGYEGSWNEAAIAAAADVLANAMPELSNLLGYQGVWRLIAQVEQAHRNTQGQVKQLATKYWEVLKPVVSRSAIVYTSTGEWRTPDKAHLLDKREIEQPCLPILEQLNLPIVHPELNTYHSILRTVGVDVLNAFDLSEALVNYGLDEPVSSDEAPYWLRDPEQHELLAAEVDILLGRVNRQSSSLAKQKMTDCAIAKSINGRFCPPSVLWNASPEVVSAFEPLGMTAQFAAFDNPVAIKNLVRDFDVAALLTLLEQVSPDTFAHLWTQDATQILALIGLCAAYKATFRQDTQARERLRKLKIWPAGDRLHSLHLLDVPGNFVDPFGLATLVDERVVSEYHKFLTEDLKAQELTIQHYAGKKIPDWCNSGTQINAADCQRLLTELAKHINTLQNETQVKSALATCALIPCQDNTLRAAKAVYFASEEVSKLLGENVPVAIILDESKLSVEPFLKWLGVAILPRPADVVARINTISQQPSSVAANRESMQKIFYRLGKYWDKYSPEQHKEFEALRVLKWLPVEDRYDRWFAPSEVHTLLQKYLFSTTGQFLDVPYNEQNEVSALRQFLPIETRPSCELVVKHLLNYVAEDKEVHKTVYAFLNDAAQNSDPAIQRLKGQRCLSLEGNGYVRPDEVFWKQHKFHPYLLSLSSDFEAYRDLLKVLQVREEPQATDAIKLLCTITDSNDNKRLDDAKHTIMMECWALISHALQQGMIEPEALEALRERKVIPNQEGYLQPPGWMFFEDKPKLAEHFGEFLKPHVILRTLSAGLGMERAGVRLLSRAVEINLVECTDPRPAEDLQQILQERRLLIEQVIYPERTEDRRWNTNALETLQLQWCSWLEVGYTLKAFNQAVSGNTEAVDTFYDFADSTLYIQRSSEVPWLEISSGLAYVMNRDAKEGTVAANLFVALSAPSLQKGSKALDSLKVPPLQADEEYEAALSIPASMGGIDTSETDGFEVNTDIEDGPIDDAVDEEKQEQQTNKSDEARVALNSDGKHQQAQHPNREVADSTHSSSTEANDSMSDRPLPTEASGKPANTSKANDKGMNSKGTTDVPNMPANTSKNVPADTPHNIQHEPRSPANPAKRSISEAESQHNKAQLAPSRSAPDHNSESRTDYTGRLRSYVFSTSTSEADEETRRRNTEPIDKAGMARVLDAEQRAGRIPEAMPHNNPGYDIYSLDATGENERYIEVKSLSGGWQVKGVQVSAKQFIMAQRLGPKFWLYVVERADQDDFCITRIQNPAQRVNEFMFDDGWRACMEVEEDVEK